MQNQIYIKNFFSFYKNKNSLIYEYILKEKDIDSNRQLASDKTIKGKNRHNTDILNMKLNQKANLNFKNLTIIIKKRIKI